MNSKLVAAIACATATVVTGLAPAANAYRLGPVLRQEEGDPKGAVTSNDGLQFSFSNATGGCPSVFNCDAGPLNLFEITEEVLVEPLSKGLIFVGPFYANQGYEYNATIEFGVNLPVALTGVSLGFSDDTLDPVPLNPGAYREVTASFTNNGTVIPGLTLTANDTSPFVNQAISVAAGRSLGISINVNLNAVNARGGTPYNGGTGIYDFFVNLQTQQTTVPEPGNVSGLLLFSLCGIGLLLKRQQTQS
jgi:hypothetical protein